MYYDYHTELDLIKEWTHLTEISLLAIHQLGHNFGCVVYIAFGCGSNV